MTLRQKFMGLCFVALCTVSTAAQKPPLRVTVTVVLEGRPAPGFQLLHFDGERTVTRTTSSDGVAELDLATGSSRWDLLSHLEAGAEDFPQLRKWEVLVKLHLPPDFGANFLF